MLLSEVNIPDNTVKQLLQSDEGYKMFVNSLLEYKYSKSEFDEITIDLVKILDKLDE